MSRSWCCRARAAAAGPSQRCWTAPPPCWWAPRLAACSASRLTPSCGPWRACMVSSACLAGGACHAGLRVVPSHAGLQSMVTTSPQLSIPPSLSPPWPQRWPARRARWSCRCAPSARPRCTRSWRGSWRSCSRCGGGRGAAHTALPGAPACCQLLEGQRVGGMRERGVRQAVVPSGPLAVPGALVCHLSLSLPICASPLLPPGGGGLRSGADAVGGGGPEAPG